MDDFYNKKYTRDVFEFVDKLNYIICWDMLKHQNLIFNQENSNKLFQSNRAQLSKQI